MTLRAVIFDLDDTLYLERDYVFSGYRAVAAAFANRLHAPFDLARRMQELFETPDRRRVFDIICQEAGVADPDHVVRHMIETYRNHAPAIELLPDAQAALDRCRGRYRLGLLSDGEIVGQTAKLDALGVHDRFEVVVFTDRWGREFWKPHPRGFEEMTRQLDVSPNQCLYVSDNLAKDFAAPNRLGWHTVRIVRPGGIHTDKVAPEGGEPGHTISTLDELDGVIADTGR